MMKKIGTKSLFLLLGGIIGWHMMRTPLTEQSGLISTIVMGVFFVLLAGYCAKKYGRTSLFGVGMLAILGISIEYIGIRTCFPYGCFTYGPYVGPKFLETFPWSLLFIRPVIVVTILQGVHRRRKFWKQVLLGGVLLTCFDLFLDPVAVEMGLRSYAGGGDWFGVPWSNYLGWLLTGSVSAFIFLKWSSRLLGDAVLLRVGLVLWGMYVSGFLTMLFS